MKKKRIILGAFVLLSSFTLLSANSLESLVNTSIGKSSQITNLELNKNYTLLSLEGSELEAKTKVNVSYNLETPETDNYVLDGGTSSLVSIVIPGSFVPTSANQVSDTTTISIDGGLDYTYDATSPDLNTKASLNLSHNFLIGDYTNNLKSLNNQITVLKATQAYESGVNSFKKNLYSYVSNIISNEKSQKEIAKNIVDQEKVISDSLTLNQITKDSILYKQYLLILQTYKDTLENLKIQNESLIENFKDYTGVDYVKVDEIREPNLELNKNSGDSISVQLAQLNVKLKQNDIDQVEREKTQSHIAVSTAIAKPYDSTLISYDMSALAQATYNSNNFSLNAGTQLNLTFGSSPDVEPAFRIGGTWTNDTTSESDLINNKLNENALISAQLALNSTIQSKMLSQLTINSQITNWVSQYQQLIDNIQFKKDSLELKKQMFDLGLASQNEVDDLIFEIEQLKYDELTLLIDGLSIELDIQKINL